MNGKTKKIIIRKRVKFRFILVSFVSFVVRASGNPKNTLFEIRGSRVQERAKDPFQTFLFYMSNKKVLFIKFDLINMRRSGPIFRIPLEKLMPSRIFSRNPMDFRNPSYPSPQLLYFNPFLCLTCFWQQKTQNYIKNLNKVTSLASSRKFAKSQTIFGNPMTIKGLEAALIQFESNF